MRFFITAVIVVIQCLYLAIQQPEYAWFWLAVYPPGMGFALSKLQATLHRGKA